jgi:hypothetical protein
LNDLRINSASIDTAHGRYLYALALAFVPVAVPLRAANMPQGGTGIQNPVVWTNDDVERLYDLGLISIAGRVNDEADRIILPRSDDKRRSNLLHWSRRTPKKLETRCSLLFPNLLTKEQNRAQNSGMGVRVRPCRWM